MSVNATYSVGLPTDIPHLAGGAALAIGAQTFYGWCGLALTELTEAKHDIEVVAAKILGNPQLNRRWNKVATLAIDEVRDDGPGVAIPDLRRTLRFSFPFISPPGFAPGLVTRGAVAGVHAAPRRAVPL